MESFNLPPWGWSKHINYLYSVWEIHLFPLICLFIQSLIKISMDSWILFFNFVSVLLYFIAQNVPTLAIRSSFCWLLYPFDIFPLLTLYVYVLFEHLLALAVWESPDLPCLCPASVLGSAISLRSPESSHWRKGIVTKILGVLLVSQVLLLLGSLSWQEGVYVCVLILCMYIYEYFCM